MTATGSTSHDFLAGAGEMGERIRHFDWTHTPLGPIDSWPQSLKTSVSLILGSRHPMWIGWGPQMTFLYNDAYLHVLGPAKHPHALGRPASEIWAEIWDVCGPLANNVFENGEATFVDDVRLFMDRGHFVEETFYSFSYSPIRDERGAVAGLFCPSTDVTAKTVNTRRLRSLSELSADSLIEKTTAGACATAARILSKNPDDIPFALLYLVNADHVSAHLEQTVGFAPGASSFEPEHAVSLTGQGESPWPLAEVFHFAQRQIVSTARIAGLPRGVAGRRIEDAVVLPVASRGERQPYGVLVAGVNPCRPLDPDHLTFFELLAGQVATAIQNARAVEEEKKRADMLAEIDRAKTVFFSNVSHEFRTPLTLMLGPIENLMVKPGLAEGDREQLAIAHRNSLRLLKLVNSLLEFSRLEAGRLGATFSATDLSALTKELASNFRSAMDTAGLELIVDCEPLPEPVYVDREMWEKVVLNLLSNAFKFTFEGRIAVRLRAEGGEAVLTVSDTGIGIPETELPRIFERFHRVEGARGRIYEGTGIGLALIQEYVKLHHGSISAASRLGEGSAFTVKLRFGAAHLPEDRVSRQTCDTAAASAQVRAYSNEAATWLPRQSQSLRPVNGARGAKSGSANRPRVLLADDNADMREHVSLILGEEFEVVTAKDGFEALEQIRLDPPDLLLTDVMMPGCDGFGLLRAVRADDRDAVLPVIFLSARAGEEMRVEGLDAGADDYLVKPFTANELRARVKTHIRMAVARRQGAAREAALRAEAEAARDRVVAVLEGITDGFISVDPQWRVSYVNAETERLCGMLREDMIGKGFWQLFPEAAESSLHRQLFRAADERAPVDFENYYQPMQRWFHLKVYPRPEGGLAIFYEDITARKEAEEQLRQSEERYRAIVDTTPECVKVVGGDGTLLHMNSAGLAMVGAASADQLVGRSVYDLIAPEFHDKFRAFNENVCRGQRDSLEYDIVSLQGQRRKAETHAVPLHNPDGTVVQLAITRDITERRSRERSALLLSAIVDSSDDAIISKDLNGVITSWNYAAERLFGYTAQEAIGKSVVELLIPADRQEEETHILNRLRRGERFSHFETVRRRKDGSLIEISLTISPMRDFRGVIVGASKIARDITDRKRIETAVQSLNAQLTADLAAVSRMQQLSTRLVQADDFAQLLGEIVDAGIEIMNADMGHIQLLEEGALRIVSYRGFEPRFLDFFSRVRSGEAACGTALGTGQRVIVEDVGASPIFAGKAREEMLAAGGRAVQSTPLVSRSGQLLGMFSTLYRSPRTPSERELRLLDVLARQAADLIERKRAETALVASEGKFRQLADAMPQIVWTAQPDGSLDYYNERWYEFTGFDRDKFGDDSWIPILHPEDIQRWRDAWYGSVRTGSPQPIEYRFRDRRENRWRWFIGRALPVRDEDGRIVKWFGSCTDIDDQKRVEEDLRRANQDLEQFAYSASHDLQEPLRSIKIYGELLAERYGSRLDGQAFAFLDFLRTGASRMEALVRDLLAYTQVTRVDAPPEPCDANEALNFTLANLSQAIKESRASITAESLPLVRIHAAHLRQLFQNLIGNALKYRSPERACTVHISASRGERTWVFAVRDNGIGIEAEYTSFIFGLFKRLHTGDEYSGTGIGLAICQRIVERYHGRIWVESEFGHGSTFYFEIPSEDSR